MLGEFYDSLWCAALDIFKYPLSLKARKSVVVSWLRQNFDQIESILYFFLYFFKYMLFLRF